MISVERYIEGVSSIYVENPEYKEGHDGSDGYCDCIGMCKGAIRRAGGDASGMSGTNYAARNTIRNLKKITASSELKIGDVVLKTRQPGDSGYALPDKYKNGTDLTDYYHIGTVTQQYPLNITHMTSPRAKIDTQLGKWSHYGQLPQVDMEEAEPLPDPEPEEWTAKIWSENGGPVNLRKKPSLVGALIERIKVGENVDVLKYGADWCQVRWKGKTGYMMTKFLIFEEPVTERYTVTIEDLSYEEARALKEQYPKTTISVG